MIWAIILGSVVFLVFIMLATVSFTKLYLTQTIGKKHKELEAILETREVPKAWSKRSLDAADPSVERRLAKLIEYVQRTRLVDGEETRSALLEQLAAIKEEWNGRGVDKCAGNEGKDAFSL
jgi:uncharacterized protein YicC (UPF0701 family)